MLVHPDKNMGSPLASESFKKLQCAYEVIGWHMILNFFCDCDVYVLEFLCVCFLQVLSDIVKKRDYDEQLRKEESRTRSVCQTSHASSHQV